MEWWNWVLIVVLIALIGIFIWIKKKQGKE